MNATAASSSLVNMLRTSIPTARAALRPSPILFLRPTLRTPHLSPTSIRTVAQHSHPRPRKNPTTNFTLHSSSAPSRKPASIWQRLRFLHNSRAKRNNKAPSPDPTPNLGSPKGTGGAGKIEAEPQGLTARLKKLSREYGWSALGVYLLLTAVDLPLCYLLVRWLGTDRIGEWEHVIVSNVKRFIPESIKTFWHDWRAAMKKKELEATGDNEISEHVEMAGWGVEEAEERNKADASLATQLALAYAIHKSFIFIRVPITAAITPKVVKLLRSWGWNIGKRADNSKEARAIRRAALPPKKSKKPKT